MTTAELIEALRAFPPNTRVILADVIDPRDKEAIEAYADCETVATRYVSAFELDHMKWDFSVAVEPWAGAVPVALLKSQLFERAEYHAPVEDAGTLMMHVVKG